MNTLLVWECGNGDLKPDFYLIPTELLKPYHEARNKLRGFLDNEDDNADVDMILPEVNNAIEHLAYMIGDEPFYGKSIPSLGYYMKLSEKSDGVGKQSRIKPKPVAEAPWAKYKLQGPNFEISGYVNDVFLCGWMK